MPKPLESRVVSEESYLEIECVHCGATNWVNNDHPDYDVEKIVCHQCKKESLLQGVVLEDGEQGQEEHGFATMKEVINRYQKIV